MVSEDEFRFGDFFDDEKDLPEPEVPQVQQALKAESVHHENELSKDKSEPAYAIEPDDAQSEIKNDQEAPDTDAPKVQNYEGKDSFARTTLARGKRDKKL